MWFKHLIVIFLFFIFFFAQTIFLPRFNIISSVPNFVFVLFFLIIFFEEKKGYDHNFFPAFVAGFFLDIYPLSYFGLSIVLLSVVHFFKETADYFLEKTQGKYIIFYFISLFSACFVLYDVLIYFLSFLLNFQFNFGWRTLQSLAYSLIFAIAGFYVWKTISDYAKKNRQLKLF